MTNNGPDKLQHKRLFTDDLNIGDYVQNKNTEASANDLAASIIIVNFNGWDDLEKCLDSLLENPLTDSEIIVVDNCSTDGSAQKVQKSFPNVKLIQSKSNLGFGGGNNLGAIYASGRTLVFLNPDTTVAPSWLPPLLKTLDSESKIGMVTSRILLMDNPGRINTCGNDIHISGLAMCRGMGQNADTFFKNRPDFVAAISGAAFAIRKELFQHLGGFDEVFFLYMEDTDLSLRLRLAGYQIVCVPESTVFHDYVLTFGSMKTFYQERNRYLMLLKCFQWSTLILLIPVLLLAEVVTWGYILWRDRKNIKNKWLAYDWIRVNWVQIMQKRKKTQGIRNGVTDKDLLGLTTTRIDFSQTGTGWIVKLAVAIFDPLFLICRQVSLLLIR